MFFQSRGAAIGCGETNPVCTVGRNPGLQEVIDVGVVLLRIQRVLSGKPSTVSEVNFQDSIMFAAGEIHNNTEA